MGAGGASWARAGAGVVRVRAAMARRVVRMRAGRGGSLLLEVDACAAPGWWARHAVPLFVKVAALFLVIIGFSVLICV